MRIELDPCNCICKLWVKSWHRLGNIANVLELLKNKQEQTRWIYRHVIYYYMHVIYYYIMTSFMTSFSLLFCSCCVVRSFGFFCCFGGVSGFVCLCLVLIFNKTEGCNPWIQKFTWIHVNFLLDNNCHQWSYAIRKRTQSRAGIYSIIIAYLNNNGDQSTFLAT